MLHKSITVCLLYKSIHTSHIMVPIDAAEFDAHKNINTVIIQFLCHNKGKGFSAKEIADAVGIKEEEVNHAMVKLSLTELFSNITAGLISKKSERHDRKPVISKIEDITINGSIYYRCVEYTLD
jgi:DNA-directed RNA polymerase specialized sigma subunit